ncbi:hypothetical protein EJ02DRAFT_181153 [Clathrospora elynae]|uniref:Uncharacterized protein n=1 Tax=Clathrospora elynae TaxID=706981 RepID=A0A6A5SZ22_9PLEO|nr:hypothetical protein EJ02DRAFT_181153 [Clathrospora elynae]
MAFLCNDLRPFRVTKPHDSAGPHDVTRGRIRLAYKQHVDSRWASLLGTVASSLLALFRRCVRSDPQAAVQADPSS